MYKVLFKNLEPLDGFNSPEKDGSGAFIWTKGNFSLKQQGEDRFILIRACYYGREGTLSINIGNDIVKELKLSHGWNLYVIDFGYERSHELKFKLDKVIPVDGDERTLGLMVRMIEAFGDEERFKKMNALIKNKALNEKEFLSGKTKLQSYPTHLRIDIENKCNIVPRCAYCSWGRDKAYEANSQYSFTNESFTELGMFYTCAEEVVDCSIGEPFLNNDIFEVIDSVVDSDKTFIMVSNGLLLNETMQKRLYGKNITLAISLDTSDEESYKRLRGDGFGTLIKNLKLLCKGKKAHNDLPVVNVAFIVMRSNIEGFPEYVKLIKEIGADNVIIRSLNANPDRLEAGNENFNYKEELLSVDELTDFIWEATEIAKENNLGVINEWSFGDDVIDDSGPLCQEPWNSAYLFKRGFHHCCFALESITHIDTSEERSLHDIVREAFNSEKMQEIRTVLAKRYLPDWCLKCTSCPIVKKMTIKDLS